MRRAPVHLECRDLYSRSVPAVPGHCWRGTGRCWWPCVDVCGPGWVDTPGRWRHFESQGPFMEEMTMALQDLTDISAMTDEVYRTRSQKRAMERDGLPNDVDMKKPKMECSQGTDMDSELEELKEEIRIKTEPVDRGGGRTAGLLKGPGEVKATIKVEVPTGDEPVDMSTSKIEMKKVKRPLSPDIIVLSDNEPSSPRLNGLSKELRSANTDDIMKSTPEERERMIKQLKEELRLEEAKLVLLKKLRQSQIQKEATIPKPAVSTGTAMATPPPLVRGTLHVPTGKPNFQVNTARAVGTVIPPPLVRGVQQGTSKVGSQQNPQIVMPPLVRGNPQIHAIRPHASTAPPPLMLAPRASVPSAVQIQGQRVLQQGLIRVANVPNTSLLVNIPQASSAMKASTLNSAQSNVGNTVTSAVNSNDSPASRQAAAKLALRKQLEKTLLEIPPPKPPAPELNFLPSAANNEFIYLVGLEEVVHNLLETQGKTSAQALAQEPYACSQCKTDFTCRWRQGKTGTIMCEQCVTSNQKKALKAEHTNRLKAAFVKALQQEQEIEQRILQQTTSSVQSKQDSAVQHHTFKQSSSQLSRGPQSTTARGVLHTFSQSSQLQNVSLVSRQGKHGERAGGKGNTTAWRKQISNTGVTMAYVSPNLSGHKTSTMDRQREYLLDMIPSRSISHSTSTWK
ncbi:GATA zinc finger domain containing 2Ab isoform X7 [Leucoraja erinacea]|uniref:GATA zinc finger domain containing 2Ab isoform X7 n=1 Tax=Leucoraja erinaceus TaxID=7782 RepID=UPI002457583A|nr:GATA zinc finger domain containing 2Ab isoform X7 [Leucoraja erinacea]